MLSSMTTPMTQFHSRCWPCADAVLVRAGQEDAHQVQEHDDDHQVRGDAVDRADPRAERDRELDVLDRRVGALDRRHVEEQQRAAREDEQEAAARRRPCRARTSSSRPATACRSSPGTSAAGSSRRPRRRTRGPLRGRRLQNGRGWTPGALAVWSVESEWQLAMRHPTVRRKSWPTSSRRSTTSWPSSARARGGTRPAASAPARRRWSPSPVYFEPWHGHWNRCVSRIVLPPTCRLGLGQRLGARRAAEVRADRRDRVERVALAEHEQPLVGQELQAVGKFGGQAELHGRRRVVRDVGHERAQRRGRLIARSRRRRRRCRARNRNSRRRSCADRRSVGVAFSLMSAPDCRGAIGEAFGDRESLHRHRVGRAADRAQAAPDAAVVVLDHRGERQPSASARARSSARAPASRSRSSNGTNARQYSGQTSTQRLQSTHSSGS